MRTDASSLPGTNPAGFVGVTELLRHYPRMTPSLNDEQLLRYSRHILLDELGIEAQEKFLRSHALIIGAGGLGSPAALYLAASGVGTISLVDHDQVDLTNLQRQILHDTPHVGHLKVESGCATLGRINPEISLRPIAQRVDEEILDDLVAQADVVLDCCDNFQTRHALNRACVRHRKALVSGAAIRFSGQVSVFDLRTWAGQTRGSPCYACLFPEHASDEAENCATSGVFAPLVGIIGSTQAAEALKCLANLPGTLAGRLLMLDAREMNWQSIQVPRDPECKICARD